MSMYMNTNGQVRPVQRGPRNEQAEVPGGPAPIEAGKAAEAMATAEESKQEATEAAKGRDENFCGDPCKRSVAFCETFTLHEAFDASCIDPANARIAYDTSFLCHSVETVTMPALLPCGCQCQVPVQRLTITGAIPYLISVGPVTSQCGGEASISVQGNAAVDEVVRYICGEDEPEVSPLTCEDVTCCLFVSAEPCGCSDKTNVTLCGRFIFQDVSEEA